MSDVAVRVEHLSKQYRLGDQRARYSTFRDALVQTASAPLRWMKGERKAEPNTIWALDDVSFEIKHGEAVGIIGRNGAGKSTLLKILSRITRPTRGRVDLYGRVGSLLEVGTGFHPELSGRENIYLNGAILGMSRAEIQRKFDEIVDFADVEKFLDTPVKFYSSGMYVRLAFAVAAHLEPEILVVDEVLAVGDAGFQKKCLGKMGEVAHGGRTVLFVSHNMGAIQNLCYKTLLFEKGKIKLEGLTKEVISKYLMGNEDISSINLLNCDRKGNGKLRIYGFQLENIKGNILSHAVSGSPIVFSFYFENNSCTPYDKVSFSFGVHTNSEDGLFHIYSHFSDELFINIPKTGSIKCLIPELMLSPGNYLISTRTVINGDQTNGEEVDWPQIYIPFSVLEGDFYKVGNSKLSTWGPILVKGTWFIK